MKIPESGRSTFHWSAEIARSLGKHVDKHGSIAGALKTTIARYNDLCQAERTNLMSLFTKDEFNLMLNNALSTVYELNVQGAVYADTYDEVDATFQRFGVNRNEILLKLAGLNIGQQYALVEWLEDARQAGSRESKE